MVGYDDNVVMVVFVVAGVMIFPVVYTVRLIAMATTWMAKTLFAVVKADIY